jgi:outer membrane receptor protein involved in Fe transport
VTAVHEERPWPQFEFAEAESRHWEVRVAASVVGGPLGLEFGVSGSRLFAIDDESDFVPFVPEAVGRVFATLRLPVFGDDMRLRPRIDLLAVGDRNDLDRQRIGGHARLDGTLVAVMGRDLDLELGIRNLTDRRYPLAVLDPAGELYVDSGRMSFFFLRWRFLN